LLFAATLAVYPLIHYVVQFEARYRYPIFWATLIPAAYALNRIFQLGNQAGEKESSAQAESELLSV